MQRKHSRRKPYKPYEKRVDLIDYQRLMRFLRWMTPQLSSEDALRMLPESDAWSVQQLKEKAQWLDEALTMQDVSGKQTGFISSLTALIPYIVTGTWGWPVKMPDGLYRQGIVLVEEPTLPGISRFIIDFAEFTFVVEPTLLEKDLPTIEGLCQLASDLREALRCLVDRDDEGVWELITRAIRERIIRQLKLSRTRGEAARYYFADEVKDLDFRVHCFWLLAKLLAEGHAWRVTGCVQCGGVFLKTRRDPPQRPSRFCGESCRRGWHNPKRPKKGVQP